MATEMKRSSETVNRIEELLGDEAREREVEGSGCGWHGLVSQMSARQSLEVVAAQAEPYLLPTSLRRPEATAENT